jgi:hypothetical protein
VLEVALVIFEPNAEAVEVVTKTEKIVMIVLFGASELALENCQNL